MKNKTKKKGQKIKQEIIARQRHWKRNKEYLLLIYHMTKQKYIQRKTDLLDDCIWLIMAAKGSDKVLWWEIVAVVVVVVTVAVVVMVIVVVVVVVVVIVVTWTDWELLTDWGWLATEWRRLVVVAQLVLVEAIPAVPAPVPATTANHTALTVVQLLFFPRILFIKIESTC